IVLHLPLAFDACRAIGQGIQSGYGYLSLANLADAIDALLDPTQGPFNLIEFPSLQLRELGRNLVAAGVERDIRAIARSVRGKFSQVRQFAGQRFPQSGMAAQEGLVQSQQGVSSCHGSPPLEVGRLRRSYTQESRRLKHSGDPARLRVVTGAIL